MKRAKTDTAAIMLLLHDERQADVYRERLKTYGYAEVDVFAEGSSALQQITEKEYALLIADVQLRGEMDGIDTAAAILKNQNLPLIYLSQLADEATFRRATETRPFAFLSKPLQWIELRMAIHNALYWHPRILPASNGADLLQGLINSTEDLVAIHDREGGYLYFKGPAELGISADEVVGKHLRDFFEPAAVLRFQEALDKVFRTGKPLHFESEVEWLGEGMWREENLSPVRDEEGKIIAVSNFSRNITERKLAQQELKAREEQFHYLFEQAPLAYQSLDTEGKVLRLNEQWCRLLGYTKREVIGRDFGEFLVPEQKELFPQRYRKFKEQGSTQVEFTMARKDGTLVEASINGKTVLDENGKFSHTHCLIRDVTLEKEARNGLLESEARFRMAFEYSGIGMAEVNPEGKFLRANKKISEILGYSVEKLLELNYLDITHPDDRERSVLLFSRLLKGELGHYEIEKRYLHADGRIVWGKLNISAVPAAEGTIAYCLAALQDITHEKESLGERDRLNDLLSETQKIARIGSWEWNFLSAEVWWSDEMYEMYNRDKKLGPPLQENDQWLHETIHPEDQNLIRTALREAIEKTGIYACQYRMIRYGDKAERWIHASGRVLLKENGEPERLLGVAQDITEQKTMELELAASEERYRLLFERSGNGIGYYDTDLKVLKYNDIAAEHMGGMPEEFTGKTMVELFGDEGLEFESRLKTVLQTKQILEFDDEVELPAGRKFYHTVYGPVTSAEGEILGVQVISSDITSRRRMELEVKRSNDFLLKTGKTARVGGWELDLETDKLYWSEVVREIHEVGEDYDPDLESAIGFYHGQSRELMSAALKKAIEKGIPYDLELELNTARGQRIWIRTMGIPEMQGDQCLRLAGTLQDIDENKKNRIELHRLNEALASHKLILDQILENAHDQKYILDRNAVLIYASNSAAAANGRRMDHMPGKNLLDLDLYKAHGPVFKKQLEEVFKKGNSLRESFSCINKGKVRYYEYILSPMKGLDGRVEHVLNLARDVTERVQMENELRKTSKELALLNRLNSSANEGKSMASIARQLSREINKSFGVNGSTLYLLDKERNCLIAQNNGLNPKQRKIVEEIIGRKLPEIRIHLGEGGFYRKCLEAGKMVLTTDPDQIAKLAAEFTENKALKKLARQITRQLKINCVMALPITLGGEAIGLLDVSCIEQLNREGIEHIEKLSGSIANIIARKTNEEALARSEEKYRAIIEGAMDGVNLFDQEGNILETNEAYAAMIGYSMEELKQMNWSDIEVNETGEETRKHIRKIIKAGSDRFETRHRKKDGSVIDFEVSAEVLDRQKGLLVNFLRDVTARKAAERALKRASVIVESTSDAVITTDTEGVVSSWNRGAEQIFKYTSEEMTGRSIGKLYRKEDQSQLKSIKNSLMSGRDLTGLELTVLDKNHKELQILLSITALKDAEGNIKEVVRIAKDISEIHQSREQLKLQAQVFAQVHDAIFTTDMDGNISDLNPGCLSLFGYQREELLGKHMSTLFPEEQHNVFMDVVIKELSDRKEYNLDIGMLKKNAEPVTVNLSLSVLTDQEGQLTGTVGYAIDVSDRVRSEQALKESERMLNATGQRGRIGGWEHDLRTGKATWTRGLYDIIKIPYAEDPPGVEEHLSYYPPEDREKLKEAYEKAISTGKGFDLELQVFTKERRKIWCRAQGEPVYEDGRCIGLAGIFQDITTRKKAELSLVASEARYRHLFEKMAQGVFYQDAGGRTKDVNPAALKMFGITKSQFAGRTSMDPEWKVVDESGRELKGSEHPSMLALASGKPQRNKVLGVYNPKRKDYVWLSVNALPQFQAGEQKPYQVFVTMHDLTAIKKAEEELRERNVFIEAILDNIPIAVAATDIESGKAMYSNASMEAVYGWPKEDLTDVSTFFEKVYPDIAYREEVRSKVMADIQSGDPEKMHWEGIKATGKDGRVRIVNARNIPLYDQNLMISTAEDVTHKTAMEEQLHEALDKFQNVVRANPSGIFIYRYEAPDRLILEDANPAAEKLTGIFLEKWRGREFDEIWPNARKEGITDRYLKAYRSGETWTTDDIYYEDKNLAGAFRIRAFRIPGHQLVVAFENITEVKKAEQALIRERDRANQYLNIAASIIMALDREGNITLLNDDGARILECPKEKAIGLNWFDHFLPKENIAMVKDIFQSIIRGDSGQGIHVENFIITAKGKRRAIRWHNHTIRDDQNRIIGTLSSGEDITERKAAETALRESEERYKELVEKSGVAIVIDGPAGNFKYFNRDFAMLFGYRMKEVEKLPRQAVIHPEDREKVDQFHEVRRQGKKAPSRYEIRGLRKDGRVIWLEVKTSILSENGQFAGTRNYIWDISERKNAEAAVKESEARFRTLFGRLRIGVAISVYDEVRRDFVIRDMNDAGLKIVQARKTGLLDQTICDCLPGVKDLGLWDLMKKVHQTGSPEFLPASYYSEGNLRFFVECHAYKLPSGEIIVMFSDVSERIRAESALKHSYEEIRNLTAHIERVREEERQHIARDLHDDFGQILTAVKMDISSIRNKLPGELSGLQERTDRAKAYIDQAIEGIHKLSADLRPPVLDNLGLFEAIKSLIRSQEELTNIESILELPEEEPEMPPELMIVIYRVVQEGLTNIMRHAKATRLNLKISKARNILKIELSDNGVGISGEQINAQKSFGLIGMRERIKHWNGEFNIEGLPDAGTSITIRLPLK